MNCDDGTSSAVNFGRGAMWNGTSGVSSQPNAQNLRLAGGRPVSIDAIHVEEPLSAAGIVFTNSTARAFHEVASYPTTTMPGWGEMPIFVVPPVSVRRDALVLPRWKVWALLRSEALERQLGPLGGGSQLVLVFYCDDLASSPVIDVIARQLASLDEATWRMHAQDWEP
jgi:hypothetical protein